MIKKVYNLITKDMPKKWFYTILAILLLIGGFGSDLMAIAGFKTSSQTTTQAKTDNTEEFVSKCDGSTLEVQAIKLDCIADGKPVYFEMQRELLSYMHGKLKYTNWVRVCTKDMMARFLTVIETSDEDSTNKSAETVGVYPNAKVMDCKNIGLMLRDARESSDWLLDPKTKEAQPLGNEFKSVY